MLDTAFIAGHKAKFDTDNTTDTRWPSKSVDFTPHSSIHHWTSKITGIFLEHYQKQESGKIFQNPIGNLFRRLVVRQGLVNEGWIVNLDLYVQSKSGRVCLLRPDLQNLIVSASHLDPALWHLYEQAGANPDAVPNSLKQRHLGPRFRNLSTRLLPSQKLSNNTCNICWSHAWTCGCSGLSSWGVRSECGQWCRKQEADMCNVRMIFAGALSTWASSRSSSRSSSRMASQPRSMSDQCSPHQSVIKHPTEELNRNCGSSFSVLSNTNSPHVTKVSTRSTWLPERFLQRSPEMLVRFAYSQFLVFGKIHCSLNQL